MSEEVIKYIVSGNLQSFSTATKADHRSATFLLCRNSLISIGLTHLLADTKFAVAGVAPDEGSFSSSNPETAPALFIIDGSDSPAQIIETAGNLKDRYPEARIAVIADTFDLGFVRLARNAGVDGFCLSASGREVLIKSLELVMLGEVVLPASVMSVLLDAAPMRPALEPQGSRAAPELDLLDPRVRKLSTREAEILQCLTEGAPNKTIARKLDVAEATVKVHIKAILRKIGAANRTQAAMWATTHLPANTGSSLRA
jgi:two-component system nitrate/nitrite response regulator NarL